MKVYILITSYFTFCERWMILKGILPNEEYQVFALLNGHYVVNIDSKASVTKYICSYLCKTT